jgi:hypothetical protein
VPDNITVQNNGAFPPGTVFSSKDVGAPGAPVHVQRLFEVDALDVDQIARVTTDGERLTSDAKVLALLQALIVGGALSVKDATLDALVAGGALVTNDTNAIAKLTLLANTIVAGALTTKDAGLAAITAGGALSTADTNALAKLTLLANTIAGGKVQVSDVALDAIIAGGKLATSNAVLDAIVAGGKLATSNPVLDALVAAGRFSTQNTALEALIAAGRFSTQNTALEALIGGGEFATKDATARTTLASMLTAMQDTTAVSLTRATRFNNPNAIALGWTKYPTVQAAELVPAVLTISSGYGALTTAQSFYQVPSGKWFILDAIVAVQQGTASMTTAATALLCLRVNAAGVATVSSPLQEQLPLGGINSTTGDFSTATIVTYPSGRLYPPGSSICFSLQVPTWSTPGRVQWVTLSAIGSEVTL